MTCSSCLNLNVSLVHVGDGVESQSMQESPEQSTSIVIPEDFESKKDMVRRVMIVLHKKLLIQICLNDLSNFHCFAFYATLWALT